MKYTIIWSAFSEKQIDNIFEYYRENVSPEVAKSIVKTIILAPAKLIDHPKMGAKETLLENRRFEYHYIVKANYKIIYSVDEKNHQIKISDIFDTRQNPVKIEREK